MSKSELRGFDFQTLLQVLEKTHLHSQAEVSRAVNRALVARNWLFGRYIVEFEQNGRDRAEYEKETLKQLSQALTIKLGRGFSEEGLSSMRRFYNHYSDTFPISRTLSGKLLTSNEAKELPSSVHVFPAEELAEISVNFPLPWSHYLSLMTVSNADERKFYEIEAEQNSWSVRELSRQINSGLFQRLALSKDKEEIKRLATEGQIIAKAADLIKNPLVLEFLQLDEKASYSEESAIIDKLQAFLLEMGKGFLFESRQRRFTLDEKHFYVDLVLYNCLLHCYVLLDLKLGEITHGDLGQMQMYVNYFDRQVKLDDELPSVGMVLCARKNDALVELTLPENANIFASKYQLYLPSKAELKEQLERIEEELTDDSNSALRGGDLD